MGESKTKKRRHSKVLEGAKGCIYCAEVGPAEQVDHMPPRAMFRMSQRPKGLEFPSCSACNQGTSRLDVVATFMARTFPGIDGHPDEQEWDQVMREVGRVAPDLPKEMIMPPEEMQSMMLHEGVFDPKLAAFRANGPILGAHMQAFAAKVGFALRYEDVGYPVPGKGGVQVRWFTSSAILNGTIPESLYASLGPINNLRQGKMTSEGVFEYGCGDFTNQPDVRLYYAKVRTAFSIAAFVADDRSQLPFPQTQLATFAPGELSHPLQDRIYEE
jgi:hypothetical protein